MRIVYLCPVARRPVGGIKVIYRHAELLAAAGVDACVLHPEDPDFACDWFAHRAPLRPRLPFDARREFLVLPEVWAPQLGPRCVADGLRHAIFVQGGYLIDTGRDGQTTEELRATYRSADLVLTVSDDSEALLRLAVPGLDADRILRVAPPVGEVFGAHEGTRQRRIAFMPRKLPGHARQVAFLLEPWLPAGWQLQAIDGLDEAGVAGRLAECSIFMAFSELEGFALPPLEAALSGVVVVGYTGQGAREYFAPPVFREVAHGDFRRMVEEVLKAVADVEAGLLGSAAFSKAVAELRGRYSAEVVSGQLRAFAGRVEVNCRSPG